MTTRRFVHEKTLELNLCAEILQKARVRRSFASAFVIGMTQERESRNGVDATIHAAKQFLGAVQFKAPLRPKAPGDYRFTLPQKQLEHLQRLEQRFPGRVSYYLPRIATKDELRLASPYLMGQTNTLPVAGLALSRHRVVATPGSLQVFSDPVEITSANADQELEHWLDEAQTALESAGTPNTPPANELLGRWLSEVDEEPRRIAGQILRGLAVLAVPQGTSAG